MDTLIGIVIGIIVLTVIIVIHELGHALVARRNGVVVEEFGIGFPPRAKGIRLKDSILGKNVLLSLNWLPIGGFVKLQGEHDADDKPGDYGAATFWQKTKILLAGVVMNWLTAIVILTILAAFGVPKLVDNQFTVASDTVTTSSPATVSFVGEGSPADKAGLQNGDELARVGEVVLTTPDQLSAVTESNKGKEIDIVYRRDDVEKSTTATLRAENKDNQGYLGASTLLREFNRSTWSAPIVGVGLTVQFTQLTLQGLGDTAVSFGKGVVQKLSTNDATQQKANENLSSAGQNVAGPVGLLGAILPGLVQAGASYVLLIAAIISISLAVLNALPIPALDGGRFFVTAVYRVLRRPLSAEREEVINGTGFLLLMGLFVLITIADVGKFL